MTIEKAQRDKVEMAYETFGGPPGDPLLLVTGVGAQMIYWHDEFCASLVERRFWVARFDNRDAGLSTHLSSAGVPNQLRMLRRPAEAAVNSLEDMADDAVAVLDALGWEAAHVVAGRDDRPDDGRPPSLARPLAHGRSAPHPRLGSAGRRSGWRSACCWPTRPPAQPSPGHVRGGGGADGARPPRGRLARYPLDEVWLRGIGRRMYERGGIDVGGRQRQNAAILAGGDRRPALAAVRVPTLVVHGEADSLVRIVGGRETAAVIPERGW